MIKLTGVAAMLIGSISLSKTEKLLRFDNPDRDFFTFSLQYQSDSGTADDRS